MKTTIRLVAAAALALPAIAAAEGFNVSARASTLGLGADVGYAFNDYVNLRVGFNNYTRDYDTTEDDIDYEFDLELDSTAIMLDYHPFGGTFRLTAGMLDNKNELNGQAASNGDIEIGSTTYTSAEVGTLYSNVKLGDSNPLYVGLGFSQALGDAGWGFGFDVGMVLMGKPTLTLTPEGGSLTSDPNFQADLEAEEQAAQADLDDFENYPVIALGLTFQF